MPTLIERNGCIFDKDQVAHSFGYEGLDPVGQEAFVNHVHFDEPDRKKRIETLISSWEAEMKAKWPGKVFHIYVQEEPDEITARFHMVRTNFPNWLDGELEGMVIKRVCT
jgi:hypothetical protein